jgi:hypothetical protein
MVRSNRSGPPYVRETCARSPDRFSNNLIRSAAFLGLASSFGVGRAPLSGVGGNGNRLGGTGSGCRRPEMGEGELRILPFEDGSVSSVTASRRVESSGMSRDPSAGWIPRPMTGSVRTRALEGEEVLGDGMGLGGRGRACGSGFGLEPPDASWSSVLWISAKA